MILTNKKQISFIFILCFTLVYAQNVHAMRCNIKSLTLAHKARNFKALTFCSKSEKSHDDLKELQQIYNSLELIQPNCFAVIAKNIACKQQGSCCLLAKKDAEQAQKGKAARLKKKPIDTDALDDDVVYMHIVRDIALRLAILQQKDVEAHTIFLESQDKEAIMPLHENICDLTTNISECLTYSANIYGTTFYECSGRYYKKHPRGLFDSTQDMTPQEHEREKSQNECNKINKALMKRNGQPLNQNILLGWGKHTMDPAYTGAWLDGMEQAMRAHEKE